MDTNNRVKAAGTFSDDPIYDSLLWILADLAGEWRETKSDEAVKKYQIVLKSLLEMGWNDNLDLELLLPSRLMPIEYTNRHQTKAIP